MRGDKDQGPQVVQGCEGSPPHAGVILYFLPQMEH